MITTQERVETKTEELNTLSGVKLFQENVSDGAKVLGIGEELRPGEYFQQGDCILAQLGDVNFLNAPDKINGELSKDNVILKGITNSHALYDGEFDIYRNGEEIYVDVKTFAILDHVKDANKRDHAEHHAQYIPKGKYFFKGILEFDHLEKMARQVID